jgi:hypothetical protein
MVSQVTAGLETILEQRTPAGSIAQAVGYDDARCF